MEKEKVKKIIDELTLLIDDETSTPENTLLKTYEGMRGEVFDHYPESPYEIDEEKLVKYIEKRLNNL